MPIIYRQIRIFIPPSEAANWVENVVGRVIKPSVLELPPLWFWFSRYGQRRTDSGDDTNLAAIPDSFNHGTGPEASLRSVRFRVALNESDAPAFEARVIQLIQANGYAASSFLDYDWIGDLAADRFIAPPRTEERRRERAELVAAFFHSTARVFFHVLEPADESGQFYQETVTGYDWGMGSSFEPLRHIFINTTHAPSQVEFENNRLKPHHLGEPQIIWDASAQRFINVNFVNPQRPANTPPSSPPAP